MSPALAVCALLSGQGLATVPLPCTCASTGWRSRCPIWASRSAEAAGSQGSLGCPWMRTDLPGVFRVKIPQCVDCAVAYGAEWGTECAMEEAHSSGARLLESFVEQTEARLKAAVLLGHGGEIGRAREQALRDLLGSFLPPSLGVTTGFVIDAHGGKSLQQDIIVHFADYHARFELAGIPLVPIEAVIAVIEVKSDASSKTVLRDCYANLASVKRLDRSNSGSNRYLIDRHPVDLQEDDWNHFQFQVFVGVLALRSPSRKLWLDTTLEWCEKNDRNIWPSFFCGIDDYIGSYDVQYSGVSGTVLCPDPTHAVSLAAWCPTGESPLAWAVQEILNFVRVAKRIDYLPTSYLASGETPVHRIATRDLT